MKSHLPDYRHQIISEQFECIVEQEASDGNPLLTKWYKYFKKQTNKGRFQKDIGKNAQPKGE